MRINVLFEENNDNRSVSFSETDERIGVNFGQVSSSGVSDYRLLSNKPSINSVTLEGALSAEDLGLGRVYYDTTANWDRNPSLMSVRGAVYIYSDYEYLEDGAGNRTPIAGLKIGDGNSYLTDLPFVNSRTTYMLVTHIMDSTVHISEAEREFWDNKISAYIDPADGETLVLSKTHYELNGVIRSKG